MAQQKSSFYFLNVGQNKNYSRNCSCFRRVEQKSQAQTVEI